MLTWLDLDPTRGMTMSKENDVGWDKGTLVCANGVITLGKVRFAPDMDTLHSQKGDSDLLWSEV